ncbi:hypothetical protein M8C21_020019, partial [Ambrosia artemisiifolia]
MVASDGATTAHSGGLSSKRRVHHRKLKTEIRGSQRKLPQEMVVYQRGDGDEEVETKSTGVYGVTLMEQWRHWYGSRTASGCWVRGRRCCLQVKNWFESRSERLEKKLAGTWAPTMHNNQNSSRKVYGPLPYGDRVDEEAKAILKLLGLSTNQDFRTYTLCNLIYTSLNYAMFSYLTQTINGRKGGTHSVKLEENVKQHRTLYGSTFANEDSLKMISNGYLKMILEGYMNMFLGNHCIYE